MRRCYFVASEEGSCWIVLSSGGELLVADSSHGTAEVPANAFPFFSGLRDPNIAWPPRMYRQLCPPLATPCCQGVEHKGGH